MSRRLKSSFYLHSHVCVTFPATVLTPSLSSAVKVTSASGRRVLPGRRCHSTMYKHWKKKRHIRVIGALIISISVLGGTGGFRWRYKDKERREGGGQSQRCLSSQWRSEPAKNAPGARSSWPDIRSCPTPFHTRVTCWSSERCASTARAPMNVSTRASTTDLLVAQRGSEKQLFSQNLCV